MKLMCPFRVVFVLAAAMLVGHVAWADEEKKAAAKQQEAYRVPYQLSDTKHVVVRVKINGKGPLNFIVDTGAPLLYLGTDAAKKVGAEADKNGWATFDKLEIEGGIALDNAKGRIEDPFQLIGMNKMNLPGIRYDGILGYTVLAQFRIQFDFTDTHLVWTKLDWQPPTPKGLTDLGGKAPPEFAMMSGMVNLVTTFVGRRPDAEVVYRGFLGIELAERANNVVIQKVLPNSPAAEAGLQDGDVLRKFQDKDVKSLKELHGRAADHLAGRDIAVEVDRNGQTKTLTIKTIKGL